MRKLLGVQRIRRSTILAAVMLALVLPAGRAGAQATVDRHLPVTLAGTNPGDGAVHPPGGGWLLRDGR